jgi:1,4-dihydroxy-2-naphthoate octaprenyltransferase
VTAWAWLPFAAGVPLLPVHAWVGAVGRVPAAFALLVPLAVAAGAAVALANGLVDPDRDRVSAARTPAVRLGVDRARGLAAGLLVIVIIGVAVSLAIAGAPQTAWLIVLGGTGAIAAGLVVLGTPSVARRERGWEATAMGIGLLAAGWAIGLAERGLP